MPHPSRWQAIRQAKCPRCRRGKLFEAPFYHLGRFAAMHKHCPHCQLMYQLEPGFFDGAMYVSYALSVGLFLTVGFVLYFFFGDPDTWVYITTVVVANILLIPVIFRVSRVLYLHLFGGVKYNPRYE